VELSIDMVIDRFVVKNNQITHFSVVVPYQIGENYLKQGMVFNEGQLRTACSKFVV